MTVTSRLLTSQGVIGNDKPMPIKNWGPISFVGVFEAIVPAQNKYMALIFNTSTAYDVWVERIYLVHNNVTAATGVVLAQSLIRVSAFTTGTAVTPVACDPSDAIPSGVSLDHNSSAVSDVSSSTYANIIATSEELIIAGTDPLLGARGAWPRGLPIWESGNGIKPLVLHGATAAHRGLAIKNITSSTAGSCSYLFHFSCVPV